MVFRRREHAPELMVASLVECYERFLFPEHLERCWEEGLLLAVQHQGA